jgi:hypothetical protein
MVAKFRVDLSNLASERVKFIERQLKMMIIPGLCLFTSLCKASSESNYTSVFHILVCSGILNGKRKLNQTEMQ